MIILRGFIPLYFGNPTGLLAHTYFKLALYSQKAYFQVSHRKHHTMSMNNKIIPTKFPCRHLPINLFDISLYHSDGICIRILKLQST